MQRNPALEILLSLTIPFTLSLACGKRVDTSRHNLEGVILFEGKRVPDAYVTNISRNIRTKSDENGKFSIPAGIGDQIVFSLEDKSAFLVVSTQGELKVELKPNERKIFYLKNFESDLIQGEIFLLIPSTEFISPVLSDGRVILNYPPGTSEMLMVKRNGYTYVRTSEIGEFSFLDMKNLRFAPFPEKATVTNASGNRITLRSYFGQSFDALPGETIWVPPGIYCVSTAQGTLENIFVKDHIVIEGDIPQKIISSVLVEGEARTSSNESDVLIWVEGTSIVLLSSPKFSIRIPQYSKRIYFSKVGWYPQEIELDSFKDQKNTKRIDVELRAQAYVTGRIYVSQPPSERFQIEIREERRILSIYVTDVTEFSLIVPQGSEILLSISAHNIAPKIMSLLTSSHHIDVGNVYMCAPEDEECIIDEGKKFLRYALYRKAREAFALSKSSQGKVGLLLSGLGIIFSEEQLLSLSEEVRRKSLSELSKIYDEIDKNIEINILSPLCFDEIRLNIPFLGLVPGVSASLKGCIGEGSLAFIRAVYGVARFLRDYLCSHKLLDRDFRFEFLFDPNYLVLIAEELSRNKDLLSFVSPPPKPEQLATSLEMLRRYKMPSCSQSNEMFCTHDGFINARTSISLIPLIKDGGTVGAIIDSLLGNRELQVSDILDIVPFGGMETPDFVRINLRKLLSNPLRKFFPAVLTKDFGDMLAVEVELPEGFKGITNTASLGRPYEDMFTIGDSRHFKIFGVYLLDFDEVFPTSNTSYFDELIEGDFIVYFYFNDPTFGEALKLLPCEIAGSEKVRKRYNCPRNEFLLPDNQMLNDVLASLQKRTSLLKLFLMDRIMGILNIQS